MEQLFVLYHKDDNGIVYYCTASGIFTDDFRKSKIYKTTKNIKDQVSRLVKGDNFYMIPADCGKTFKTDVLYMGTFSASPSFVEIKYDSN